MLYGSHKQDDIYDKCLSFEVRLSREASDKEGEAMLSGNKSYHLLKAVTSYHECFRQIEKDLNRTFDFREEKKVKF